MVSKGKRKNLVEQYPYSAYYTELRSIQARLLIEVAGLYSVPVHMLCGMSRSEFKRKYSQRISS